MANWTKYNNFTNEELLRLQFDERANPEWIAEVVSRFEVMVAADEDARDAY